MIRIVAAVIGYLALIVVSRWLARDLDIVPWVLSCAVFALGVTLIGWVFDEWRRQAWRIRSPLVSGAISGTKPGNAGDSRGTD